MACRPAVRRVVGPRSSQRRLFLAVALLAVVLPATAGAQGMPDPKEIAGFPLPVADVAVGTVTVRVIKDTLSNNLAGQTVELTGAGAPRRATTNDAGRAEFAGLPTGARVRAAAVVAGQRLESQEFAVPATGGIRLILVATDPETDKRPGPDRGPAQAPAQSGMIALGEQSRFIVELGDESLSVFNILQILNPAGVPVQPAQPLVFDLPDGAEQGSMLEASAAQGTITDNRVHVNGPFAPGSTIVQFAYSMPYAGPAVDVAQVMPARLARVAVLVQKVGDMRFASQQASEQREVSAEGQQYIMAQGPALEAGNALAMRLTGLPHAPRWPRNLALALAGAIVAAASAMVWRARPVGQTPDGDRAALEANRERLFAELTEIEQAHRAGRLDDARYETVRAPRMAALERIYAELDAA